MPSSTPSTALVTPLPPYRSPPSRSSTASKAPVEAPLGTAARAMVPSSRATSTSTVGFPRESRISRAPTASMLGTGASLTSPRRSDRRSGPGALGGLRVELAGVPPNRLPYGVLDVPSPVLGRGDDGQEPLPQLLGAADGQLRGLRRRQSRPAGPPHQRRTPRRRRLRPRDALGRRAALLLRLLDLLPAGLDSRDVARANVAEHVRVAAHQLVHQVAGDLVDGEPAAGPCLGGHPGVEDHLQQDVAQFLPHRDRVVVDDRVVGLVRLLEQVPAQ